MTARVQGPSTTTPPRRDADPLRTLERRLKDARTTAHPTELPGLNRALNIVRDTITETR